MHRQKLIKLLSDGEFHSGSELGEFLGVSRTAVWKELSKLEGELAIESHKGKGYRISGGLDLLDEFTIRNGISDSLRPSINLKLLDSIDSTNDFLMGGESLSDVYSVCLAERQVSGKGRRGNKWYSPYAKNIYLSLRFDLNSGVEGLEGLSLVAGIACVKALSKLGYDNLGLKWPNDIWYEDKKLAGILVELQGEATTHWTVVVGIGLNVHMDEANKDQIDQPWTSLSKLKEASRNDVAIALLNSLIAEFDRFRSLGFSDFEQDWKNYDCLVNRQVFVQNSEDVGVARGITEAGALRVEIDGNEKIVSAGEVSVRPYAN